MRRNIFLFMLMFISITCFAGFALTPVQTQIPVDNTKYFPGNEWRVSTPELQGMDSQVLLDMYQTYGFQGRILIIRNGYLVSNYKQSFLRNDLHHIHSCTKSIISTLFGKAIEEGYLTGIHQKVLSFFPEVQKIENRNEWKEKLTLYHLLTMSSGMEWTDSENPTDSNKMSNTKDWTQYVLDRPVITEPGQMWNYNSGGSQLLSVILQKATGKPAQDYAREKIFKPLGIAKFDWWKDPHGHSTAGWGLHLSSFDLAKIGYLFLREGRWKDQQIIPVSWVKESTTNHISVESGFGRGYGYGYQWWVYTELPFYAYKAWGSYGRHTVMISIIPGLDMVVVFAGDNNDDQELLNSNILPAIKSANPLPPNPKIVRELKKVIDGS